MFLAGIVLTAAVLITSGSGFLRVAGWEAGFGSIAIGLMAGARSQALQRRADGVRRYAGPSPFLVFAAWVACLETIAVPITYLARQLGLQSPDGGITAVAILYEICFYLLLYVGLVYLLVVRTGGLTWRQIVRPRQLLGDPPETEGPALVYGAVRPGWEGGRRRADLLGDVLLGIAVVIPILLLTGWLNIIVLEVLHLNPGDIPEGIPVAMSGWDRFAVFLAVAVITPIGEEIFFRGFATNAWARTMRFRRAVIQAGLFFASVHVVTVLGAESRVVLQAALFAIVARVPVALALGWLYLQRRSIAASITLHAGFNGTLLLASWYVAAAIR